MTMTAEVTEQYLKIIYKLTEDGGPAKTTDLASALDVAPASVTEMLHKLSEQGYVKHAPYKGVALKPKGRKIATKVLRKHRLLERFLADFVGITGRSTHEQACKMEHVLTDEAEHNLCRMMHHPAECPDGKKIPKCEKAMTCEKCTSNDVPLSQIKEGESAVVSHLVSRDQDEVCSMLSMGFVPGSELTVEKRVPMGGPIIVSLKGTKVAIARDRGEVLHVLRAG
jgi:DtxR family Mn-dependent transcriptional regulator